MKSRDPEDTGKGFTFVDRRGTNVAEVVTEDKTDTVTEPAKGERTWEEVCYLIEPVPMGQGMAIFGKAIGIRSDMKSFVAGYLILPIVTDSNVDWRQKADERLNTFLTCDCQPNRGNCALHNIYIPQWNKADQQRMKLFSSRPMPIPLEKLLRQAQSLPDIMVPRG